jgi:xylulokinase
VSILLGIDLGTSAVKVLAVNERGEVVASASEAYPLHQPRAGWSEQDPVDWWRGVQTALKKITSDPQVNTTEIKALSLSGQMHGSVFLDDTHEVIRPPLLWNDTRTFKQCKDISEKIGEDKLLQLVGNPALEGFTLPKLLWLRENEPENYARLETLFLPKDYIVYRLTGRLSTEMSDAAGTLLLDVKNRCWSKQMCEHLEIDPAILPEVLESVNTIGTLTKKAADETGLPEHVKVIAGGADNACSAVGNGIVKEGIVLASLGSSGVVLAHTNEMHLDKLGRIHSFNHSVPRSWYLMGVMLSAGLSMSWLKNDLFATDYETINAKAASVAPGSEGVIFLPYLSGERTPHRDPKARGVFFGLSGIHKPKHMIRSVFEGVTFGLKDSLVLIRQLGVEPKQIRVTGGGVNSPLWLQMLADVFDNEVVTMQSDEGPALGAALIAGVGADVYGSIEEAVAETVFTGDSIEPLRENVRKYDKIYPLYKSLYDSLKGNYDRAFQVYENLNTEA